MGHGDVGIVVIVIAFPRIAFPWLFADTRARSCSRKWRIQLHSTGGPNQNGVFFISFRFVAFEDNLAHLTYQCAQDINKINYTAKAQTYS